MSSKLLILFVAIFTNSVSCSTNEDVKSWAVLVAGSNEYDNYRHQADICHAYHVLHDHGIPDEQIVVMMYDDIAYNKENPTKGVIINRPGGPDVYQGVPIDYSGENVTPENFLNVLLGNSEALRGRGSGKVLKSGPNDNVFVNFVDHGAPGLLVFPNGELHARPLIETLETMFKERKFDKLVLYVEACFSGSMFENLLKNNISVFAMTAANAQESSAVCYYDDKRYVYLGDVYSVKWMEDSDVEDLKHETLQMQFTLVKDETYTSHVQEYGDLGMSGMPVAEFQGRKKVISQPTYQNASPIRDAVSSHEALLETLKRRMQDAQRRNSLDEVKDIQKQIFKMQSNRKFLLEKLQRVVQLSVGEEVVVIEHMWQHRATLLHYQCYEDVVRYFSTNCFNLSKNEYALRYLYVFVNMCEMGVEPNAMTKAMDFTCTHPPVYGIN